MRPSLLQILRCPACGSGTLQAYVSGRDGREIREGALLCGACGVRYPIEGGIADLLHAPSESILREQSGWSQLYATDEADRDAVTLRLPYLEDPHWQMHAANVDGLLAGAHLRGARVLDLGCGAAWSSRLLLREGAAEVVAIDILRERHIGLGTADLYFAHGERYFERVLCDMQRLPFADGSFDAALSAAALHHADSLPAALAEVRRVLRPGGALLLVNEPVLARQARSPLAESVEIAHGINEHIYTIAEWLDAIERSGLAARLLIPPWLERAQAEGRLAKALEVQMPDNYLPELFGTAAGRWQLGRQAVRYNLYRDYGLPLVAVAERRGPGRRSGLQIQAALLRALAPPWPLGRRLSFGRRVGRHLVRGCYPPERAGDGRPFVWTAPEAELVVRRPPWARRLRLELIPPPVAGAVTVCVDGEPVGELRSEAAGALSAPVELRWDLPRAWRPTARVEIRAGQGWSPQDLGHGPDGRRLGVALFALECLR